MYYIQDTPGGESRIGETRFLQKVTISYFGKKPILFRTTTTTTTTTLVSYL